MYEYNEKCFDTTQKIRIKDAIDSNVDKDIFNILVSLNKHGNPIYSQAQMYYIIEGYRAGFSLEDIMFYTRTDIYMNPIFNDSQMQSIRYALQNGISKEYLSYTMAKVTDDIAYFTGDQMETMCLFIRLGNDKQREQLKEMIDKNMDFYDFSPLINVNIPAENIRIYHSLYELGCSSYNVENLLKHNFNYDELKKIKYLLKFGKDLMQLDPNIRKSTNEFTPNAIVSPNRETLDTIITFVSYRIEEYYGYGVIKNFGKDCDIHEAAKRWLERGMSAEEVHFLLNSGYNKNEIIYVADLLMDGADFNKIKELKEEAALFLSAEEINDLESYDECNIEK